MRLTLRTLLAYLDDILDPQDAQQLQKKIEDSEFATSLVHQIRGSVRRLRLDAPALDAQGIGGDLNSVAEYLDNVLPPDQVPALEKACLDNEVSLGEVASCHQVLTLVLGEPANINDRMRQQAYAVAPTVGPAETPPTSVTRIEAHPAHPTVPPPSSFAAVVSSPTTSQSETRVPAEDTSPQTEEVAQTTSPPITSSSKPATETTRPSERFAESAGVPSTREAWRAEAEHGLEKEAQHDVPVAVIATPVVGAASTVASGARPIYPEYMDRKSSWLRSAFVTGLVALLILAGLLFATSPVDNNFFAGWIGSKSTLLVDQDMTTPLQSLPVEPTQSNASIEVEVVDANQPTDWNDADRVGFQAEQNSDSLPAFNTTFDSEIDTEFPSDAAQADIVTSERKQLASHIAENRFDEDPLEADASSKNDVEFDETTDSDRLPELVPNADVTTTKDATTGAAGLDVDPQLVNSVPDDVVVVTPSLPPKDESPEVPPAHLDPDANLTRFDGPVISAVGSVAPLVDPGLDLEPASISPPVASPVPNTAAVTEVATSARSPIEEPTAPEPTLPPVLEPTKLRQANQLLLVFDSETDDWNRVDSTVPLEAGDFLMGLPAFRAEVEIGTSMVCTMVNAARLQLGPAADLTLHEGRLLLRNGQAANTQGVRIQGERFEIEMPDSAGVVAVQASRAHIPGDDATELPHSLVKIYAINHNAVVQYMGRTYGIEEGHQLLVLDNFQPRIQESSKTPQWATSTSVFTGDKNAVRNWKRDLHELQNMRIWLQERANRRYSERALAARCLAEMDEFDAIISALNDPEQHAFWEQHFDTLRRALTRGSETADKLQLELEKAHGARAAFMMDMIRGFSDRQLASGAAAKLVKYLDHRSLDHRVLAIQNLKSITGYSLAFQPEKSAGYRKGVVRKWKGKLSGGKITYREVPEVVALLESFAAANQDASTR